MRRQIISCLMITLLCGATGVANTSKQRTSKPKALPTEIRQVDFLNFGYQSNLCSEEFGKKGIPRIVNVRKGEFKNKSVYFSVVADKIIYADVTGDGREDAIVPLECGAMGANFSRSEVNIYSMDGGLTLVGTTDDKKLEKDYRANYSDAESYWGFNENGIKVSNGTLQFDVLTDGSHAAPKYIVTLEYSLSGMTLNLKGKPQRSPRPAQ